VLVDTLRADALGVYGQTRPTSPAIDAWAQGALIYEHAWTQYTWTLPAYTSLMVSQHARTHGWDHKMGDFDTYTVLDDTVPTLPQVLREHRYATRGMYSNGHLKAELGFGRGFDIWRHGNDKGVLTGAVQDIAGWKDRPGQPQFLYVHVMQPHVGLRPSQESQDALGVSLDVPEGGLGYKVWNRRDDAEGQAQLRRFQDAYHASVRDADTGFAALLDALELAGETERTIVVLTSDHGEMLGEQGSLGHGPSVYQSVTRVPWMISGPGITPERRTGSVGRLIDLGPTVLDAVGLAHATPSEWQGLSVLSGENAGLVVVERDDILAATVDGVFKILATRPDGVIDSVHDLAADPNEVVPLSGDDPGLQGLHAMLGSWLEAIPPGENLGETLALSEEERLATQAQLRALGYVE
jgi:arylsulfatase A-like enzyme